MADAAASAAGTPDEDSQQLRCPLCGRTDFSGTKHLTTHASKCLEADGGLLGDSEDSDVGSETDSEANAAQEAYTNIGEYHAPRSVTTGASTLAQQDQCTICFDSLKGSDVGVISCCDHLFHFDCILHWSQNANTCPLCKQRFDRVARVHGPETHYDAVAVFTQVRWTRA